MRTGPRLRGFEQRSELLLGLRGGDLGHTSIILQKWIKMYKISKIIILDYFVSFSLHFVGKRLASSALLRLNGTLEQGHFPPDARLATAHRQTESRTARRRRGYRRPAADSGRSRVGQDARHYQPHCLADPRKRRRAGLDSGRHLYQQGGQGDGRARGAAARPLLAGQALDRYLPLALRAHAAPRHRGAEGGRRGPDPRPLPSTTRTTSRPSSSRS